MVQTRLQHRKIEKIKAAWKVINLNRDCQCITMSSGSQSEIVSQKYGEFFIDDELLDEICAEFDDCKESEATLISNVKSFLAHAIDMGVSKIEHGYMVIFLPPSGVCFGYKNLSYDYKNG